MAFPNLPSLKGKFTEEVFALVEESFRDKKTIVTGNADFPRVVGYSEQGVTVYTSRQFLCGDVTVAFHKDDIKKGYAHCMSIWET